MTICAFPSKRSTATCNNATAKHFATGHKRRQQLVLARVEPQLPHVAPTSRKHVAVLGHDDGEVVPTGRHGFERARLGHDPLRRVAHAECGAGFAGGVAKVCGGLPAGA